jgi:6-phosphogluconolactonase
MIRGAQVRIAGPPSEWARSAARLFVDRVETTLGRSSRFSVVVAGGGTPRAIYELLASPEFSAQVPWERTHFFFGDERDVPPDDPASNFHLLSSALLRHVPIPGANIHRFRPELRDPARTARAYEREIRDFFALNHPGDRPRFDLVLLGVGKDGHTASLFEISRTDRDRLVIAPWVKKLGGFRYSLTPAALASAEQVVFLVSGKEKAPIVRRALEPGEGDANLPVRAIRPRGGVVTWLLDDAAASLLSTAAREPRPRMDELKPL